VSILSYKPIRFIRQNFFELHFIHSASLVKTLLLVGNSYSFSS